MYESDPFPCVTPKAAAKMLGVDVALVRGLARGSKIRSHKTQTSSGAIVLLVSRDDVEALRVKMAEQS